MRIRRARSIIFIGLTLAVGMGMALPSVASAYYYYDGGLKSVTNRGVNCEIETDNSTVGGGGAFATAFVMCARAGYGLKYMQVGYLEQDSHGDESPRYYWEWSNDEYTWSGVQYLGPAADGSFNWYKITDDSTKFYFLINGDSYGSVSKSSLDWSPNEINVTGETYYTTDHMPGKSSNPVSVGPITYKASSGSWLSAGMSEITYHPHPYGANNLDSGDTSFSIWDTRP